MNRRTAHATIKTPALTGGDDRPAPACQGRSDVYDLLSETSRTPEFDEAREAAQNMCGTCLLRRPAEARACLDEALARKERWVGIVLGRDVRSEPTARASCGRPAGYDAHRKAGERPCAPCADAERRRYIERRDAEHGTDAGYFRHLRKTKDEPCSDCRKAHAEAQAKYTRRKGAAA